MYLIPQSNDFSASQRSRFDIDTQWGEKVIRTNQTFKYKIKILSALL